MRVIHGPVAPVDVARASQLINKTNQFNTTTRRTTDEALAQWTAAPDNMALQFRLVDRFGDNGLVSVMLLGGDSDKSEALELTNWVMSCRVFGRELEHEALNIAVEAARARGVRILEANLVPTPKNGVIRDLFSTLGFERVTDGAPGEGATRWRLRLDTFVPHPTHISRMERQ